MSQRSSHPEESDSSLSDADDSIVIAIDGPAGAGKSTVARLLAERLNFEFLDTGAMYRCITLAVLRSGRSVSDSNAVSEIAKNVSIELRDDKVFLNDEDVSDEIRTPKVAAAIGLIADNIFVRSVLTRLQREWTRNKRVVTEGRDQGSDVFPHALCKIFLYASSEVRARRRQQELAERGIEMSFEAVLRQQEKRDEDDMARPVGALRKGNDAFEVCTDGLTLPSVVDKLMEVIVGRLKKLGIAIEALGSNDGNKDGSSQSELT